MLIILALAATATCDVWGTVILVEGMRIEQRGGDLVMVLM
jgi:hypothetical protein